MKLIDEDKGCEVLGRLFSAIQENNYTATQQMLDGAWKEWHALHVDRVVEQLSEMNDNEFRYAEVIHTVKAGGVNE